jgi:hypothetical protein
MRNHRLFTHILMVMFLSGCLSGGEQNLTQPPQTLAVSEPPTLTPEFVQDKTQPTQIPEGTVVMRSLLGDDEQGELANSVIELDDGGFLVAGYDYLDPDDDREWDALVMRILPDGQEIWRHSSDRSGSEYAWVVRETQAGQFVVVGAWESENGDMDGYMQGFDADGNDLWLKTYGGEEDEIFWAAEQALDGGFFLVGQTASEGAGGLDFYIVRTDADGNELWSKAYGTSVTDRAFGIGITPDGGALISGFTGANHDTMDFLILRINEDGRELWRRTIAGDRFDVAHDVLTLDDGGFVISGYTSSFSPGDQDGFIMRLTESGRMLWLKTYDRDNGDDRILHVAQLDDDGFALIGFTYGDVLVWRVDTNGELIWSYRDLGGRLDAGKDIIVTRDGSIVAVGGNRSENPPLDDILLLVMTD